MPNLRVFLVDDEALALKRLARLLQATGRVEIIGTETDSETARGRLDELTNAQAIDALLLDIQMPGLNGFELLAQLARQPFVIFTTAYDAYALQAFEVNSIDYLLKPIEAAQLDRALNKLARLLTAAQPPPNFTNVLSQLTSVFQTTARTFPTRIATRTGERVRLLDLAEVTHFFAQDKLTYAATLNGQHSVDRTIAELEQELDPARFVRIHRAALLNTDAIEEIHQWFGGRLRVSLKGSTKRGDQNDQSELIVARDRVRALKERLGF
jgi:two-component system, LytTR family, response regulator